MRSEALPETDPAHGTADTCRAPARPVVLSEKMSFFEARAARWDADHACPGEARILPLIMPFLRLSAGQRILDLGCGTGKLVPWLREGVGASGLIVEADFCRGMLEAGREKGFGRRVKFVRTDARFPGLARRAFDRAVCFALFPHLDDKARALRELRRLLRPGAPLVVAHSMGRAELNAHFLRIGGPVADDRLPGVAEMCALFADAGFRGAEVFDRPRYYIARGWA